MSKLATTLKDEFTRMGRKEANRATVRLKARIAALERIARTQRATLEALGRQMQAVVGRVERGVPRAATPTPAGDGSRLSPRLIRSLRKRLKLSQTDFAHLTGVSHVAVYLWESGKTKPRGPSREAILGLRGLGVRDVRRRLEDHETASAPSKARGGRKRAAKRPRKVSRRKPAKAQPGSRR